MFPVLFRIGSFEVTSFGLMVGLGAVVGAWILTREAEARGLGEASNLALVALVAGMAGAKLLWVGEHHGEEPALELLTSRGGLSWFGGLVGGVVGGLAVVLHRRWPVVPLLAAAAPAVAAGQALGRIGCFLVGDDYGRPTGLPWGLAFPRGLPPTAVPVHPTQIYEAAFLGVLTWLLLRWRRRGVPDLALLGRYCLLAGGFRFLLEFVRVNVRVAAGLTVAQYASVLLLLAGVALLVRSRRRASSAMAS
ncbi:MAG TPA: prolipoprotein diacylglyceryl transferase family protein [Vicinamibacteria bacterium]|nr:prolipoprotein diacylglyceryl transferase family protein [Vicinamibacteria bacterium]